MKKLALGFSALLLLLVIAMPAAAQDISCADVSFDAQIIATYPAAHEACIEILEVDGIRYAHFKALVHREGFPSMLLRFRHNSETWGPATLVQVPAGYRVFVDGQPAEAKDVPRGRELDFFMPEGRWQVAETEVVVVTEAAFEPLMFEVTEIELTDEVDMEAPPLVVEDAPAEAAYEEEAPVEQEAAAADDYGEAESDSEWLWILGLAGAFIIVWFLLRRKKARREG
ncbi:MAG: hypothetical protein N2B05_03280 [Gemmatimonadales bacterium]